MNRFNRDYALIGTNGNAWRVHAESHSAERLKEIQAELAAEGIATALVKSDLPRSRAA